MVSAIEAITGQVKNGLCFILGNVEDAARVLGNLVGTSAGIGGVAGGLGALVCDLPPEPLPVAPPPFNGGQCQGVPYRVLFSYTNDQGNRNEIEQNIEGVVVGVYTIPANFGGKSVGIERRNPDGSIQRFFQAGVTDPNTNPAPSLSVLGRVDGLPDTCGDPDGGPVPPPGPVSPELPDITYDIDGDTNITVPIAVIYAPVYVDLDGSFKMPISINVGDIDLSGTINLAPEFGIEIKPTINIGGPGTPDDPDIIGEPGGGPTEIPDSEDLESTIIGVLVYSDLTTDNGSSGVDFTNGPDLYVPRLASVQFAVKTRDSIGWTSDQDVKNLECYVPCPAPQGAIAVRVSPMPGVSSRFTAVRGVPLTEF